MKVFVDAAAWIALLNTRDALHSNAIEINKTLRKQNAVLVTTEFVLLEVADGLCVPPLRQKSVNFIEGLYQLANLQIIEVTHSLLVAGLELYKQREDKNWSLTDCISFVVMIQEGISHAFTSDRHFEQAGFIKLL